MERIQMKNRAAVLVTLATVAAFLVGGVNGDSHGAPLASCADMGARSVHAIARPDPEISPFGITLDQASFIPFLIQFTLSLFLVCLVNSGGDSGWRHRPSYPVSD